MMSNSLKGALLSGVIFPGFGQIALRHYKRGIVLMFAVSAGMTAIALSVVQHAVTALEKIESEGGVIDLKTITDTTNQASSTSDSLIYDLGLLLIVMTWIFGIIDAYRIGKKKDLESSSQT